MFSALGGINQAITLKKRWELWRDVLKIREEPTSKLIQVVGWISFLWFPYWLPPGSSPLLEAAGSPPRVASSVFRPVKHTEFPSCSELLWPCLLSARKQKTKTLLLKKLTWLSQTYLDNLCILWSIDLGLKLHLQPSFAVVLKLMLDWVTRRQESWSHLQNSACHSNPWWSLKTSIAFHHSAAFEAWRFKYFFLPKNHTNCGFSNYLSLLCSMHL